MEERFQALSSILHGCELAKQLETNLPSIANQPTSLLSSCEEICRAFNKAINLLNPHHPSAYSQHPIFGGAGPSESSSASAQNMERAGFTQAMDVFYSHAYGRSPFELQMLPSKSMDHVREPLSSAMGVELAMDTRRANAGDIETSARSRPVGDLQASDTSDSGGSSLVGTSVQRQTRRRDAREVRTVRASAPRTGNLEIPPDDGFTWRKYGQKEILNSRFPRSYYRCTHKNFYGCDAKKQVQRLDDDPHTFEVTYRGTHTCQTSPTPLILPPPEPKQELQLETSQPSPLTISTSIHLSSLFPRELEAGLKDKNALIEFQQIRGGDTHAESSHVQGGKEMDCPIVDLADAMFNPRSSSDGMEDIFSPKKEN